MNNEEIITIPNIITLCRLLLIPFFILSLVYNKVEIAILLFGAIALSDALDGLSARITKQKTRIGALLDTTTDWLVLSSTLITFLIIKKYLTLNQIIILSVPVILGLITKVVYVKKEKQTSPTIIGKITITFAYISVLAFLINFAYRNIFITVLIILSYASTINYIIKDVKIFIR